MDEEIRKKEEEDILPHKIESSEEQASATAAEKKTSKGDIRRKIWILVALLLCVGALITLVVLRSGIPIVDFWTVAASKEEEKTKITSVERIEALGGTRVQALGNLVLYKNTNEEGNAVHIVFNAESGAAVSVLTDAQELLHSVHLDLAGETAWFYVRQQKSEDEAIEYNLSLFDGAGNAFAKKEGLTQSELDALAFDVSCLDLVLLEREVFRPEKNGGFKRAFELETFASLPDFDKKVGDYYFVEEDRTFHIYDKSASLTATYRVPAAAESFQRFYLSDGTLLFQYVTVEDEHSQDYTFTKGGTKYALHHLLVSAKNGEKTPLEDISVFISFVLSDDELFKTLGMNAGIDNLAMGYPVQNGVLEENDHYMTAVLLSNRGRVTSVVGDIIPAMKGGIILGVAKNRWIAANLADEIYLLNEWGSVVGHFPKDFMSAVEIAAKLFVYEGRIYDWDLGLLYDMNENGVIAHEMVGSSVLMHKENGEALLYDGNEKQLVSLAEPESGREASVLGEVLVVLKETVEESVHYLVYNECGTALADIEAETVEAFYHSIGGTAVVELIAAKGESVEIYFARTEK